MVMNQNLKQTWEPSRKKILKISSGDSHFLALDDEGKVWSWNESMSSNSAGQLGHGDCQSVLAPKRINDGLLSSHWVEDIEGGAFS